MHLMALRLPDELASEVEKVSKQLQRTKSYIVRKALENYVREHVEYQIALDRLNDKDDKIVSSKEIRGMLGKKNTL